MPNRNSLCPCGSGLKSKWCHADPGKNAICNRVANERMLRLIMQEKHKRELITTEEYHAFCVSEAKHKPVTEKDVDELMAGTGLTRCSCGVVIPDNDILCIKCKKKG